MIRWMLQSALCLALCPLLVAQQVAAPASQEAPQQPAPVVVITAAEQPAYKSSSHETFVELAAPDSISFEEEKTGSPFQFVIDKDIVEQGVTLIHAGVLVTGTITRVRRASGWSHRSNQLDILLNDPVSGKRVKVRLTGASPMEPITSGDPSNDPGGAVLNDAGVPVMSFGTGFHVVLTAIGIIFLLGVLAGLHK